MVNQVSCGEHKCLNSNLLDLYRPAIGWSWRLPLPPPLWAWVEPKRPDGHDLGIDIAATARDDFGGLETFSGPQAWAKQSRAAQANVTKSKDR